MIAAFFWVQSKPKEVLRGYRDWILGIFRPVTHFLQCLFQIVLWIFFCCSHCCGSGRHWASRYRRRQILAKRDQEFQRKVPTFSDLEVGQRYFEGGVFNEDDMESVGP